MPLKVSVLQRRFQFNQIELDDPNPSWNPNQVMVFYSNTYPELNNSHVEGPEIKDQTSVYMFKTSVGTKG